MASLTESAYYTRRVLKYSFFVLIGLILLKIVISGVGSLWQGFYRPEPAKPDVAFGKLPPFNFPSETAPKEPMTYMQEFVGGVLPESSSSARVYFVAEPAPNFLSLERAKEFAKELGFKAEPVALSETLYQWTDIEYPLRTLQKDIVKGNFTLAYDFYKDPSVLAEKNLPYGKKASSEALNFLEDNGLSSPDLTGNEAKVSFWKSTGSELLPAPSVSEAEITRVDFFRAPIAGLPSVTPSYKEALVYFLFSGSSGRKRVLTLRYTFRPVEQGIFATYPLRTIKEAWADLEAGKGYIANWGAVKGTHVTIRRAFLAYYESESYEPYIQPVFVFEGDEGFVVYVSALSTEWMAQTTGD